MYKDELAIVSEILAKWLKYQKNKNSNTKNYVLKVYQSSIEYNKHKNCQTRTYIYDGKQSAVVAPHDHWSHHMTFSSSVKSYWDRISHINKAS